MEKDISRKIKLLKILAEDKKWFVLSELEQKLDCSSKTIRKDISVLNDLLPQNASIYSKKGKGIKLRIPQDQTICEVISNLSKKIPNFFSSSCFRYREKTGHYIFYERGKNTSLYLYK
ncbi:helix-turn-helix domain-containing protein [Paenibacillus dendritiformis]|uniref:helix-turn-helix domain-containing protein n=1 Tax=Paenibacillus dendritiformis TaxID=130049 RepID=UPI001F54C844|nr:helix-turn-helix domain-containing protein [Paenibacillus dendritiformis]